MFTNCSREHQLIVECSLRDQTVAHKRERERCLVFTEMTLVETEWVHLLWFCSGFFSSSSLASSLRRHRHSVGSLILFSLALAWDLVLSLFFFFFSHFHFFKFFFAFRQQLVVVSLVYKLEQNECLIGRIELSQSRLQYFFSGSIASPKIARMYALFDAWDPRWHSKSGMLISYEMKTIIGKPSHSLFQVHHPMISYHFATVILRNQEGYSLCWIPNSMVVSLGAIINSNPYAFSIKLLCDLHEMIHFSGKCPLVASRWKTV